MEEIYSFCSNNLYYFFSNLIHFFSDTYFSSSISLLQISSTFLILRGVLKNMELFDTFLLPPYPPPIFKKVSHNKIIKKLT